MMTSALITCKIAQPKPLIFARRERGGSKVSLEFCFKRMQQQGIDTDVLWLNIVDVVCKSLCVATPPQCFFVMFCAGTACKT